jgi:hypothetical protein
VIIVPKDFNPFIVNSFYPPSSLSKSYRALIQAGPESADTLMGTVNFLKEWMVAIRLIVIS